MQAKAPVHQEFTPLDTLYVRIQLRRADSGRECGYINLHKALGGGTSAYLSSTLMDRRMEF
jgi:hypothetical protein